eukprot:Nitzschia sp. Nitz4//scaffold225_size51843//48859//49717//NITZ4_006905-RA/size51843-snap-gene-0.7-mRNA-1//1//CDS//3329542705//3411//frame0
MATFSRGLVQILLGLWTLASMLEGSDALPCALCGDTVANLPSALTYEVTPGNTCISYYVALANSFLHGTQECTDAKAEAETLCCGESAVAPTSAPVSWTNPSGNEPICPICGTHEYPGIPTAILQMRYIGTYSCGELFFRGADGKIPDFMCGVLQDFAQPICGCGQYNPECIDDPSKCYGAPTGTPTAAPTDGPTASPTKIPTVAPTVSPTVSPTDYEENLSLTSGSSYYDGRASTAKGSLKLGHRGGSGGGRRLRGV